MPYVGGSCFKVVATHSLSSANCSRPSPSKTPCNHSPRYRRNNAPDWNVAHPCPCGRTEAPSISSDHENDHEWPIASASYASPLYTAPSLFTALSTTRRMPAALCSSSTSTMPSPQSFKARSVACRSAVSSLSATTERAIGWAAETRSGALDRPHSNVRCGPKHR